GAELCRHLPPPRRSRCLLHGLPGRRHSRTVDRLATPPPAPLRSLGWPRRRPHRPRLLPPAPHPELSAPKPGHPANRAAALGGAAADAKEGIGHKASPSSRRSRDGTAQRWVGPPQAQRKEETHLAQEPKLSPAHAWESWPLQRYFSDLSPSLQPVVISPHRHQPRAY